MRDLLNTELKTAMKSGDKTRLATIRLINAALKDRDIEARGQGKTVGEAEILALLQKMIKSRQESIAIFEKAGRDELAAGEAAEVEVIRSFLPQQMSEDEIAAAIDDAVAGTGAATIKDMGKVVAVLKDRYAGRMDFAKASAQVKARLTG